MNTNNPAQPEQNPTLNIDFSHRLSTFGAAATPFVLSVNIEDMALRAVSVLNLVSGEFAKEDETDGKLCDEIIYFSIQSAINEIKDIQSTVAAYFEAHRDTHKAQKNPRTLTTKAGVLCNPFRSQKQSHFILWRLDCKPRAEDKNAQRNRRI